MIGRHLVRIADIASGTLGVAGLVLLPVDGMLAGRMFAVAFLLLAVRPVARVIAVKRRAAIDPADFAGADRP